MKKAENYYKKISHLYNIMYNPKTGFNHKSQVKWIDNWRKKLNLNKTVLDLACGTGKHLREFKKLGYKCQGIDASNELLKIAKKEVKCPLKKAYFHNFRLNNKVPLITSFFNSMTYNTNKKELLKSLKNIHENLETEGIFIFDILCPKNPKKTFVVKTFQDKNIHFSRTFSGYPKNKIFHSTMSYIVFDGNKSEIIEESSKRGIFTEREIKSILKKSGFKLLYSGEGYSHGLTVFVAQKF